MKVAKLRRAHCERDTICDCDCDCGCDGETLESRSNASGRRVAGTSGPGLENNGTPSTCNNDRASEYVEKTVRETRVGYERSVGCQ